VLNASTTCALAGAALAVCCAADLLCGDEPGVGRIESVADVDDDLAASASPYWLTTGAALP
jgi:hypothetical protein